jgi:hypothetical protein
MTPDEQRTIHHRKRYSKKVRTTAEWNAANSIGSDGRTKLVKDEGVVAWNEFRERAMHGEGCR